ncbi:MAG: hypothetical protein CYPHOPRED_005889 [Cyphobasidiales sp. Tagirdzhanova-0007]|nr:MAG: hypothetical protein CYPHOPRED_005889 [Cyphobasidiales sp. Tagirdzhanova-0007]
MPVQEVKTAYPLIDADPYAGRVLRYMRPADFALWAGATVTFPALLYGYEMADPTRLPRKGLTPALKLCTYLGFMGGFLLAYQRSSLRFWGWIENDREQKKDMEELSAIAKQGKPVYGSSDLPEFVQGTASRNSVWSQLKFSTIPWFNLVRHQHHGVDTTKYYVEKED